jgi:hypothetical protein
MRMQFERRASHYVMVDQHQRAHRAAEVGMAELADITVRTNRMGCTCDWVRKAQAAGGKVLRGNHIGLSCESKPSSKKSRRIRANSSGLSSAGQWPAPVTKEFFPIREPAFISTPF